MASQLDALKDAIVDTVKAQVQDFLTENKDAREFLEDRAKRMAKLGLEYLQAGGDADREVVLQDMKIVQQTIRNDMAAVAVNAAVASRETFMKVLSAAGDVLIKALPVILSSI
jgi:hypothetical protein